MDMKVTMMLADHAQVADGKLFVSGGGWTCITAGAPFGIALLVDVPWDRLNEKHKLRMELVDADGLPVSVAGPSEDQPVWIEGEFVGGRHPEHVPGIPLTMPLSFNVGGVPLEPGQRYRWQLTINGESREEWTLAFSTRQAPPGAQTQVG